MLIPIHGEDHRRGASVVTPLLVVANVWAYLHSAGLGAVARRLLVLHGGVVPAQLMSGHAPSTLATSLFLHADVMHLVMNMWFLMVFGRGVERAMGSFKFTVFYFAVGIVGALAQCLATPASTVPMIGASGAIAGVMGAYAYLYPRTKIVTIVFVLLFVTKVRVPALLFLGLWFVSQFMLGSDSGIAWVAHVGGFVAGLVLGSVACSAPAVARTSKNYESRVCVRQMQLEAAR